MADARTRLVTLFAFRDPGNSRFVFSIAVGFVLGVVMVAFRDELIPEQFSRDSQKIWRIANLVDPEFVDQSFTPVANVYRAFGLAENPTLAAFVGYLLACAALLIGLMRSKRYTAGIVTSVLIFASFALAALYLGQYSKDVFVLPIVIVMLLLPRQIYWDVLALGAIAAYAYWMRSYWGIVLAAYIAYRLMTLVQPRLRYMLMSGALGATAVGAVFYFRFGRDPNFYRTQVINNTSLDVNTQFVPFSGVPQPWAGFIDIFMTYWLVIFPIALPFLAGAAYIVVMVGIIFIRVYPLSAARSSLRWPSASSLDGAIIRRSLSLILAFGAVQAVFEPDYGSILRHFTPLLPLALAMLQAVRSGTPRVGDSRAWSWTGRAIEALPVDDGGAPITRAARRAQTPIG